MTPGEFKAWFDGFCEAFDKAPTQKQWARIKERVAEIDGKPVTEKVFVDRYIPYGRPWYWNGYYQPYYGSSFSAGGIGGSCTGGSLSSLGQNYQNALQGQQLGSQNSQQSALNTGYNSVNAMNALGRAEAQALTQ